MNQPLTTHRWRNAVDVGDLLITKHFSWSGETLTDTPAGMLTELEKLGEAVDVSVGLGRSPLRAVSNLTRLYDAERPTLLGIAINVYDVSLVGSSEQDAATLATIKNMVDPAHASFDPVDAYMTSRFRNSVIGGWQPNFIRPQIQAGGIHVLFEDLDNVSDADRVIGLDVPWCAEINMQFSRKIQPLNVWCPAGQIVGSKIQRYAVSIEMLWDLTDTDRG